MGAKIIDHGNRFTHQLTKEQSLQAEAWLNHYLDTRSEPMPHADIYHLHVSSKKAVFNETQQRQQYQIHLYTNFRTRK